MTNHYDVPYYSQLTDISAVEWRMEGCGIAALAMEIAFYKPNAVSVDKMLDQAIATGAIARGVGSYHQGLSNLATKYGLVGKVYDLSASNNPTAFGQFKNILKEGPVIVSIRNKFNPASTLGHIIVVTGINDNFVFYSDPASRTEANGEKKIAINTFLAGWKKRFITVRDPKTDIVKMPQKEMQVAMLGLFEHGPLLPIGYIL